MKIMPINAYINNNETSFKKINIVHENNIPGKLLLEIAENEEIKKFAKYLSGKNADLDITSALQCYPSRYTLEMIAKFSKEKTEKVFSKIFDLFDDSFKYIFRDFNADATICKLDDSYVKPDSEKLMKKAAMEKIEEFNKSLIA